MDKRKYLLKQTAEQDKLLRQYFENPDFMDPDIFNLKMMLLDISPQSRAWRRGYVRSLKRAIKALEQGGRP